MAYPETTSRLELPFLEQNQASKHITLNESLIILDCVAQLTVIDRDLATPPGSPGAGNCYIIAPGATGAWTGSAGKLAIFYANSWTIITPRKGWVCYVFDEDVFLKYDTSWELFQHTQAASSHGAASYFRTQEELLELSSGTSVSSTITVPANSLLLGACAYVVDTITGPSTFSLGDGSSATRFGSGIGLTAGTTYKGMIAPALNVSAGTITVSADGGAFTGGSVRISIHTIQIDACML